jgi:lactam utilization protein B
VLQADDETLMQTIHLANITCGFHASDVPVMNKTVTLAKQHGVLLSSAHTRRTQTTQVLGVTRLP